MDVEYNGALIQLVEVYSHYDGNKIKRQIFYQNMGYAESAVISAVHF